MSTLSKLIVGTYRLTIDYYRRIEESVMAGKYDWANEDINDRTFPPYKTGKEEVEMVLFHFNRSISRDYAIAAMKQEGFRPATTRELLIFGEKYPEIQLQFPIVALGDTMWRRDIANVVGRWNSCLCKDINERNLNLVSYFYDWDDKFRFLAVRIES